MVDLLNPPTYTEVKQALTAQLYQAGIVGVLNWQTGSVPSAFLETEARANKAYLDGQVVIVQSGLNSIATASALDSLSYELYQNTRGQGKYTVGQVRLTDTAGAGPFTFDGASVSFTVGKGGLRYNGLPGSYTLPQNGSVLVWVQSQDIGAIYSQIAAGSINTFARGQLPGVSVTNTSGWLTGALAQAGTDTETDDSLRARNAAQWATLGVGSPAPAYAKWAKDADPTNITRTPSVLTNLDLLDPGRVGVIIAGPSGAVGPSVVLAAQNNIAPQQVGGVRIPCTARAVVSSAVNRTIFISGTVRVQREYNTPAFQTAVATNLAVYQSQMAIGAPVSWERILGVILLPAGTSAGVIVNVDNFLPNEDVTLAYNEVAVFDVTGLVYQSV